MRCDILFVVESDKAAIDVEAQEDGILGKIVVPEMETVPVGTVVGWLVEEGEQIQDGPKGRETNKEVEVSNESLNNPDSYILSSPLARDVADKNGLDLSIIPGSGPNGSIVEDDVLEYLNNKKRKSGIVGKEVQLTRIQMVGAEKMLQSWSEIPQFTLYSTIKAEPLLDIYKYIKETEDTAISINVLFFH